MNKWFRYDRPALLIPVLTLVILILATGCDGRERTNLLDPANPDTHGSPGGLSGAASCNRVELRWSDFDLQDLSGVNVYRAAGDQASLTRLTDPMLPPETIGYIDSTAVNGTQYEFTLELLFDSQETARLLPVTAQPGPALPWVADPCGWGMTLLAPDCRRPRQQALFGHPILDIDIDPEGHRVFAPLIDADRIEIFDTISGEYRAEFDAIGPSCISWQPALALLAAGAFYDDRVYWFTANGEKIAERLAPGNPEDVALRDSSTTWVALRYGGLQRFAFAAGTVDTVDYPFGRAVAVEDDPGRGCWVADRDSSRVVYISDDLSVISSAPGSFERPVDVSITGDGYCWIADQIGEKLVRLDRDCHIVEEIFGVGEVTGITWAPPNGDLWITRYNDSEVSRIDADGEMTTLYLSGCPRKVAGDWLSGCATDSSQFAAGRATPPAEAHPGQ